MCGSDRLAIRQDTGFERFMRLFTKKRKFSCLVCNARFRAMDRRRIPREAGAGYDADRSSRIIH
jgi:hypothetical protein